MNRLWRILATVAVLGVVLAAFAPGLAQAAPSPSPTLGSTNSPGPNPPGAADSDPSDYNGAVWVVVAVAVVALIVGGGTFFLIRARLLDVRQLSTPEDERRAEADRHRSPTDQRHS